MTGAWLLGIVLGIVVVLAVVALVVPILLLAGAIGGQAKAIDDSLHDSIDNTAGLAGLRTTIDYVTVIVAGLKRGRQRLGG